MSDRGQPPALPSASHGASTRSAAGLLAELLADQRARWERGQPRPVEECLACHHALRTNPEAVLDLVYQEVVLREEAGERPQVEEYLHRFPGLADALRAQFAVHRAIEAGSAVPGLTWARTTSLSLPPAEPVADAGLPHVAGYEVLGELGRGGMGVVYKARQVRLNRLIALKMIRPGSPVRPEQLARLRAEAEAAARFEHPHIVRIHDVGEQDGLPYICMEYVEGGGLDRLLAGKPLPPRPAAELAATLARAVHHAHGRGIIHCDLKPANILLVSDRGVRGEGCEGESTRPSPLTTHQPKIADFGLARRLDEDPGQTRSGSVAGSPSYMAPEQAEGRGCEVGPRTDVYALGAILYETLTGRPPFAAATVMETLEQVRSQEPVAPRRLCPTVPRDLETICLRCLRKQSARRYTDAEALADDLLRFLDGKPIRARPTPAWERAWMAARRRPTVATLIALVALIAALGFAGVAWQWRRAEESGRVTRRHLYAMQISQTQREWQGDNPARARQLLEAAHSEPSRGFEWAYLWKLCHGERLGFEGQSCVAYRPDGQRIAAAGKGGVVTIRDAAGQSLVTLRGHTGEVAGLAYSPDGQRLATAGWDCTVRIWDAATGVEEVRLGESAAPVLTVAWRPDGRQVAFAGEDPMVRVADVATGKIVHT
jgi:hypothetical protein